MDTTVNAKECRRHLGRFLDDVENGEVVTIARNGTPVAKLVPVESKPRSRLGEVLGRFKPITLPEGSSSGSDIVIEHRRERHEALLASIKK